MKNVHPAILTRRNSIRAARAYVKRNHPHLSSTWLVDNAPRLGLAHLAPSSITDVVAAAAFVASSNLDL
jgi:hypothetical protein